MSDTVLNYGCNAWEPFISKESSEPYFKALMDFVASEYSTKVIYPPENKVFTAFDVPAADVKCVILGQDPYHEAGQAMGLAFSVPNGTKMPPSLRNINKELMSDVGSSEEIYDLSKWKDEGVLLLNTVLTVEEGKAHSHKGMGWETFVSHSLSYLTQASDKPLVAILWGKPAQAYKPIFLDAAKHRPVCVLESAHPSPLSAYRGFLGSKPFSKANQFLQDNGSSVIDWIG